MEKLKKYFTFSETIDGTNFLIRNVISTISAYIFGFCFGFCGILMIDGSIAFLVPVILSFLLLLMVIWFDMASVFKRVNAFVPKHSNIITLGIFLSQILSLFVSPLTFFNLIVILVLIFKNSDTENHIG